MFASSTIDIPAGSDVPSHIAIIMDGNGRWAKQRLLPRVAGHRRGLETVRRVTRWCIAAGVEYLTLFAFSSENWRRPTEEVSFLLQLFVRALESEVAKLHDNNIRLRVVGDLTSFDSKLVALIREAEQRTAANTRLTLTIAANYGGRWDVMQGVNRMLREHPDRSGGFNEAHLTPYLALAFAPEPDLFIRTGGEQRISNFCLWQLAYAELWFTEVLWPDFDEQTFGQALASYRRRERRFGRTSEQLPHSQRTHESGESAASATPADPA
jgi:undecaprenyl diphosphate synthase